MIPKRFGTVVEGHVYRSGQIHQALIESVLREHHIGRVVSLSPFQADNPEHVAEDQAARRLGIEDDHYPLRGDGTGDIESYVEALSAMIQATRGGPPVLVHCGAGATRTGAAVAWYRVLVQGWSPGRAVEEMIDYDWKPEHILPLPYMNAYTEVLARALFERGLIYRVPDLLPLFTLP